MDTLPPSGQNGNHKKRYVSPETRAKMSAARLGKKRSPHSEETKRKIAESHRGKTHSLETREKLSQANIGKSPPNKGKPMTEEQKQLLSDSLKGRTPSEETRSKISEALKGRPPTNKGVPHTEEHKQKISESLKQNNPMRGRHHTDETKRILSEKNKGIRTAPFDEQHRKHLSEAATGRVGTNNGKTFSKEHREKIRVAKQGVPQSEEHRANVQAYWANFTPEERAEKTSHLALVAPGLHSTSIEIMVWEELTSRGIQFEKQKRIGRYIVDIYVPNDNLIIEVDGCWWHGCSQCGYNTEKDQTIRSKNEQRTAYLEKKGYLVSHIWEHDLNCDVVRSVSNALELARG
jgi:very-short-patch-repair endonuclease